VPCPRHDGPRTLLTRVPGEDVGMDRHLTCRLASLAGGCGRRRVPPRCGGAAGEARQVTVFAPQADGAAAANAAVDDGGGTSELLLLLRIRILMRLLRPSAGHACSWGSADTCLSVCLSVCLLNTTLETWLHSDGLVSSAYVAKSYHGSLGSRLQSESLHQPLARPNDLECEPSCGPWKGARAQDRPRIPGATCVDTRALPLPLPQANSAAGVLEAILTLPEGLVDEGHAARFNSAVSSMLKSQSVERAIKRREFAGEGR
jgi:hypothetical protein